MLLCTFPMLLSLFPMLQRRRPPSGKLFHDAAAASPSGKLFLDAAAASLAERQLFRTDCRFAPSLRSAPASCFRWLPVLAAPPRRPGQQQTSSGREEYSGLASNLAHLGRIC